MMDARQEYWEQETLKYNWRHARMLLIAEVIHRTDPASSVLDLGAGKALLRRLIPSSHPYHGLDIIGGSGSEPLVEACDFDHLEGYHLAGAPYAVVVASGLLEYLQDWHGFIAHVVDHWLEPGGLLLVSFTNARGYKNAPVQKHPEWKNMLTLPEILAELGSLDLGVEHVYPLLWGNRRWSLPVVKLLAFLSARRSDPGFLDRAWVSQFLCIARKSPGSA